MRFILNFIFFGLIFFLIYLYFPEAFATLVSWASQVWDFIVKIFKIVIDKLNISDLHRDLPIEPSAPPPIPSPVPAPAPAPEAVQPVISLVFRG
jgi:hypothetical protein